MVFDLVGQSCQQKLAGGNETVFQEAIPRVVCLFSRQCVGGAAPDESRRWQVFGWTRTRSQKAGQL